MTKRRLTSQDLLRFQMVDDPQVSPDGTQVAWVRTWMDTAENRYRSNIYLTDIASGSSHQLTNGSALDTHPRWSPDGQTIIYVASKGPSTEQTAPLDPPKAVSVANGSTQLMAIAVTGGEGRTLTNLAGGVRSPSWSSDGTRIAFNTYVDPRVGLEFMGNDEPAANEDDLYTRYNRDVLVIERVRWQVDSVGYVGNYCTQVVWIPFDAEDAAMPEPVLLTNVNTNLTAPVWSPDGKTLATTGNLDEGGELLRNSYIYLLETDGQVPVSPKQLFGLEEMRSSDLAWSPDGSTIAVCGHDDPVKGHYGNQMLWLVSATDGTAACVTEQLDRALGDYSRNQDLRRYGGDDGPRWLPDGQSLYVLVNEAGSVDLYQVARDDGAASPLTQGKHSIVAFSTDPSLETIVAVIGDDMNPGDLFRVELQKGAPAKLHRLTDVNRELLDEIELVEPIRFCVHSGDAQSGVDSGAVTIDSWMMPPVGAEPGKKYPVILYTGGGPGGMRASVFCHEFHLYAANGYAVVHCNTRGNHGYGEAFSLATRGHWGDLDYEDNIACLDAACAQFDFVDGDRRAVAGGSYGGYSAFWIIARHPEFKAAVVDRSLVNRYGFVGDMSFLLDRVEFDKQPPWEAPETYLERSPLQYVAGVQTPTLVVHSALDLRCPVGQGEALYLALKRVGVPTEFVRFPNESHELSRGGRPWHRVFRLDRYLDWFGRWL
ncbi:MAG: S9 family peptidase [Chloroflexota bacterium]